MSIAQEHPRHLRMLGRTQSAPSTARRARSGRELSCADAFCGAHDANLARYFASPGELSGDDDVKTDVEMCGADSTRPPAWHLGLFAPIVAMMGLDVACAAVDPSTPAVVAPASSALEGVEEPAPLLVVGHYKWLGFLTLVRIYRQEGGDYLLVSDRSALDGACHLRRWRSVSAADASTFDRWFTVLDPTRLGAEDECHKSVRDGSGWIVGARVGRGWLWRSRQQDGVDSPTCRQFAGACGGIMALLDMSCRGAGCLTGDEREHGFSCP
jgi:hypothetical protein